MTSFSSTVDVGGSTGGTGGSSAGGVTYGTHVWQGGFTADVTVTNAGSSPVDGWSLAFTLSAGQKITSAWSASISPSSGAVTAGGMAYNASIAPGGRVSFGFQVTYDGAVADPAGFSLNGTSCATA